MKVEDILKNLNIPYVIGPTKNVSYGMVGINCPYCQDSSNHLGIFPNKKWSCWKCKRTGHLFTLLQTLIKIEYQDYRVLIDSPKKWDIDIQTTIRNILAKPIPPKIEEPLVFPIPKEAKPIPRNPPWNLLTEWLEKRKFTTDNCILWGAKYADSGYYNSRLILPILDINKKLVGFQAKDLTEKGNVPYDQPKDFKIKSHLYGLWRASKRVIVVEGVLDVWRIGGGAVASFGKGLSKEQRNLLYTNVKEIILAWDGDAIVEAEKEARWWKGIGFPIKVIRLPKEFDPDKFVLQEGRKKWNELLEKS